MFGRAFTALWTDEGVDTSGVTVDPDAPTGIYFVTHGAHGHEFSYLRAGSAASRMNARKLPETVLRDTRLFHVSGISQAISAGATDAVFAAIAVAREAGALITYDPNLRVKLWPLPRACATIIATMREANWCLPSFDDARILFPGADAAGMIDACHAAGARGVVLKLGADGCLVSDGANREWVRGLQVNAVDATGAGDCFDGAFATRVLAGDTPFAAARFANVAAGLATTGFGAVAPLPTRVKVEAALRESGVGVDLTRLNAASGE
jgi:2-dehydro-3-deoxygluconokinase